MGTQGASITKNKPKKKFKSPNKFWVKQALPKPQGYVSLLNVATKTTSRHAVKAWNESEYEIDN